VPSFAQQPIGSQAVMVLSGGIGMGGGAAAGTDGNTSQPADAVVAGAKATGGRESCCTGGGAS
jgi:hypothetical protein